MPYNLISNFKMHIWQVIMNLNDFLSEKDYHLNLLNNFNVETFTFTQVF